MKSKIIIRLLLLVAVSVFLYSCVHDDLASASDPSSKEYQSKSLWKEDETYIKNVMQVYRENETKIKKINGTPLWDYATTMDRFDESFLMVPVVENKKVVSVLQVPRHGKNVYFIYTNEANDIAFFQNIISAHTKKALPNEANNETSKLVCTTRAISVWLPSGGGDSSPGSGQGTLSTYHVTSCKNVQQEGCVGIVGPDGECTGGSGDGDPYPYPGGDGPQDPEEPEDPCAKLKTQTTNADYKAKIEALDKNSVLSQKKETGFSESKSGVFTPLPQAASTDASDGMTVSVSSDTKGYIHTHLNDYETGVVTDNGMIEIKQPIRMFSPADVNTLMTMAGYVTDDNYSELYGTMVSSYGNYTIMFTGIASDIKTGFDGEQWRTDYVNYRKENKSWSFERLFLTFLKDKMNVEGVELYKIKSNGTVQKKH